jgi:hypothetical protein
MLHVRADVAESAPVSVRGDRADGPDATAAGERAGIYEQTADPNRPALSVYLGDLSAERVQEALAAALGDRLEIRVP